MSNATLTGGAGLVPAPILALSGAANEGTGTPAAGLPPQTFVIIGNRSPGEIIKIVFLTVEQAKLLPLIPDDALQIAVAPAGGL